MPADLNDYITPGIYAIYATQAANVPGNSEFAGSVLVMTYGSDKYRVFQLYMSCTDNSNAPMVCVRHSYYSGGSRAWSGWTRLL